MTRTVLLVAFHFPPIGFSSGLQRALSLARCLPELGWRPVVLTVWPGVYPAVNANQLQDVPAGVAVYRAPALDTKRHLSLLGRYPLRLAVPDRWASWSLGARLIGGRILRRERPHVIWSTYPIATAQVIGLQLARRSGLPWVADFRDSMTEEGYPAEPRVRQSFLKIEADTVTTAKVCTFTAPGTIAMYQQRYPQHAGKFCEVPNGFDEDVFRGVESSLPARDDDQSPGKRIHLVHSGTLYPSERDPRAFFNALATLKRAGAIASTSLRVTLRATGHDELIGQLIRERDLADIVVIEPPLGYRDALGEMLQADALLILQASNCNHQIPAKLYEYARCRHPVLALTDPRGDTAAALRQAGAGTITALADEAAIVRALPAYLDGIRTGTAPVANSDWLTRHSRQALARLTADALERAASLNLRP